MNEDVEDFLAHHGVRGMKWGVRKRTSRGDFKSRSKGQKLALVGGGVAGYVAAGKLTTAIFGRHIQVAQIGIDAAGTVAGVRLTRNFLDRHGSETLSEVIPKQ